MSGWIIGLSVVVFFVGFAIGFCLAAILSCPGHDKTYE